MDFINWYRRNRARSAELFALVDPSAWRDRPIPLRHPFAFYAGHLPAFSFLTLNRRALGEGPIDERLERLFERGIDPSSAEAAASHGRSDWPSPSEVAAFALECDARVERALAAEADSRDAIYTMLEHEQMHHETLMYIVHRLDPALKTPVAQIHDDHTAPANEFLEIPAGLATLGARRGDLTFGWDNEFDEQVVYVPAFRIQRYPVTNGDYLAFVKAGGALPPFWIEQGSAYALRGAFETLPLPLSWPVWVSATQAQAYASWRGKQLPSEAQYHRAAQGVPLEGDGNYNFERFDAQPVDAHPNATSIHGIVDLVGNGWEITRTIFAPFPGFAPMATYPQYSADFFDGRHVVYKGASPVTGRELVRPSFRNWFYADYPYAYGKFRLVD